MSSSGIAASRTCRPQPSSPWSRRRASGLVEQRAHVVVGRLGEVVVPKSHRGERHWHLDTNDFISHPRKLVARLARADWYRFYNARWL
jgi:hypothetical protein